MEEKQGLISRTRTFFEEVKGEMRKVTWPSRGELYGATAVVLVVCIVFAIALGAIDSLLFWLVQQMLKV